MISAGLAMTVAGLAPSAWAAPTRLADGTTTEQWTLANGLRVSTRHIPNAPATVITVAYRIGREDDPQGHEGLVDLLAELAFTGATDEVPERSRKELDTLRPLGWSLAVNPHLTLLTEICRPNQLPGVLHQVAERMGGVHVTSTSLRNAVATVKNDLGARYHGALDQAFHYMLRDAAAGRGPDQVARYGNGKGIETVTGAMARKWLTERFVPARAVVAITGNLGTLDLKRFVESEFGPLDAGQAAGATKPMAFEPRAIDWKHPRAGSGAVALAIRAPALTDTTHPAFFLHTLIVGGYCGSIWGTPKPPRTSNYRYAILDEPDLVRFYPPAEQNKSPVGVFESTVASLKLGAVTQETFEAARQSVMWLLGEALPPHLAPLATKDLALMVDMTTSMASCAHFGDEAFWTEYRRRFVRAGSGEFLQWRNYLMSSKNRVLLKLSR